MSLLVTGSIGIDTVRTPYGVSEDCLGGSAIYFSMAASFFVPVRLVGVIGADCPFDLAEVFAGRNVDIKGLEVRKKSKTFRWEGSYQNDMNDRKTELLELNVLAEAPPAVPAEFKDSKFVFLANTAPSLQLQLLEQIEEPEFIAADTMDCWIERERKGLNRLLKKITCIIINDEEARLLVDEFNLITAAAKILDMGPRVVVIKKGESGSIMCSADGGKFILPAYPSRKVKDPTGAGDSFAGGLMGYLASGNAGTGIDFDTLKTATAYGTVVASFTVEDFSLSGLTSASKTDIDNRFQSLRGLTRF